MYYERNFLKHYFLFCAVKCHIFCLCFSIKIPQVVSSCAYHSKHFGQIWRIMEHNTAMNFVCPSMPWHRDQLWFPLGFACVLSFCEIHMTYFNFLFINIFFTIHEYLYVWYYIAVWKKISSVSYYEWKVDHTQGFHRNTENGFHISCT